MLLRASLFLLHPLALHVLQLLVVLLLGRLNLLVVLALYGFPVRVLRLLAGGLVLRGVLALQRLHLLSLLFFYSL